MSEIASHSKGDGQSRSSAIQAKLTVSQPGDIHEQEADRVANAVMRMPEPSMQETSAVSPAASPNQVQRLCTGCDNEVGKKTVAQVQRKEQTADAPPVTSPVAANVQSLRGGGSQLPASTRAFFEPRFGADFSEVRIHTDTRAEEAAKSISARAFTLGNDIAFGAGQFAPRTPDGRRLIAHELAHVVQQTGGENRAALRLSTAGTLIVQRDAAIGLRKRDESSDFASFAHTFWRANMDKSLEELGLFLMDKVNAQLITNGALAILDPPSFGPTGRGAAGGFRQKTWKVDLDLASTATHPLATKIKDLTAEQVAEVAGVCYHEARHAEQAFLVARVVASEAKGKKDAKTIAAELDVPEFVAKAALNSTEPLPGKDAMAQIEQWRAFGKSGRHHDYWDWNEIFRGFVENVMASLPKPRPEGVDKVIAAWTALTPTIEGWRKDSLPPLETKIDNLTRARTPDAVDKQVLGDAKKIRAGIQKVIKGHKTLSDEVAKFQARKAAADRRPITVPEAGVIQSQLALLWITLEGALLDLMVTTNSAYRAYPIEADAYAAQESVMKTFLSKTKTAAPKP
jgi:hypothetical protein